MRSRLFLAGVLTAAALAGPAPAVIVDRVVATVGTKVVTLSEVREAHRVERFLDRKPNDALDNARIREIAGRLIDQALVRREMAAGRFPEASAEEVEQRVAEIRKDFGGDEAFRRALSQYGLEEDAVRRAAQMQLDILRFIDVRFRPSVLVDEAAIARYYRQTLLPKLRAEHAPEPPLEEVDDQIEQVLAQERVNQEYQAWIEQLRAQASVQFR